MKNLSAILGLLLVSLSVSLPAQAEGKNPKLWIANDGGLSRDYITNGTIKAGQGFFGGFKLRELLADNPEALALIEKQEQFNTYAHISYWAGVIPSSFILGYGLGYPSTGCTIAGLAALLATGLLTGHFASESRHYMYEAINTYNGVRSPGSVVQREHPSPLEFAAASGQTNALNLSFNF